MPWAAAAPAAVQFEPKVSVGLAHTDNLTLSSNKEAETIFELLPGFTLTQSSPRLTANAIYQLDGYYYWNHSDSKAYHEFDGELSAALDPSHFFMQLGATRSQTIRDPSAPIPVSNLPFSTNRVNRDDYYLGPTFQYPIGANLTASGSYRHTWVRYDDQPTSLFYVNDFQEDSSSFSLDNYRKQHGLSWAARASSNKTDYGSFRPWEYRQASLELGFWIGQGLRLFGTGGEESAWDKPFDPSLADTFWEAGFVKQAGKNFSLEVAAGERTFGSSKRASLDFTFRHGSMQLSYADEPTTQGRDNQDRLLLPVQTGDLLSGAGRVERYVSKRLQWSMSYSLRRTDLTLTAYDESREDRTRIDGLPLPDQEQKGADISAKWQAGAHTDVTVRASRSEWEYDLGGQQALTETSITGAYHLGSRTEVSLEYQRAKEDALHGAGAAYRQNMISLLLTRSFGHGNGSGANTGSNGQNR